MEPTTPEPKRRPRRRQPTAPEPPLTPEQTLILLRGFYAKFPTDSTTAAKTAAGRLASTRDGQRLVPELWDRHEVWLRREATRLNIQPAFRAGGQLVHWGESLSFWSREHARTHRPLATRAHAS